MMANMNGNLVPEGNFKECMKKPIPVKAIQMDVDFFVGTMEGLMHGSKGDYMMIGVEGERYPCAKDIFEKTYNWLEDDLGEVTSDLKCDICDHTEFKKELCDRCGKEIWICKQCYTTHHPEGVEEDFHEPDDLKKKVLSNVLDARKRYENRGYDRTTQEREADEHLMEFLKFLQSEGYLTITEVEEKIYEFQLYTINKEGLKNILKLIKGKEDLTFKNGSSIAVGGESAVAGSSTSLYAEPVPDTGECKFSCPSNHCHHPKHPSGAVKKFLPKGDGTADEETFIYIHPDCEGTKEIAGCPKEA